MRLTAGTFFFVVCVSGAISGGTATNEADSRIGAIIRQLLDKIATNRDGQHSKFDKLNGDNSEDKGTSLRHKRLAEKGHYATPSGHDISYYFAPNVDQTLKNLFEKAAKAWETGTCLTFKHKEGGPGVLVMNETSGYCFAAGLNVSIGSDCYDVGGVAHELGHALGLGHAHNRNDRDDYIDVNDENIQKDYAYIVDYLDENPDQAEGFNITLEELRDQYRKMDESEENNYTAPYDFGSIMHYAPNYDNPAMSPKEANYLRTMGSRFISFLDLYVVNRHYNCSEKCKTGESADCKNEGFPDPKNCTTCVCPGGYGGPLCDKKPDRCGDTLDATEEVKNITITIQKGREDNYYSTCTYWIQSRENTRIQVRIAGISNSTEAPGCARAGIEIKTNKDQRRTGYRFCYEKDANTTLTSYSNRVPIIAYSLDSSETFRAALFYRAEPKPSQE